MLFTLEQVKAAHSTVKSGADFPHYIQLLKELGVQAYTHFVADGGIQYSGADDFHIDAPAKWEPVPVAATGDVEQLKTALAIHQQGQTDYPTFCAQSAAAGVDNWVVDTDHMTCVYYDRAGNTLLTETIPAG